MASTIPTRVPKVKICACVLAQKENVDWLVRELNPSTPELEITFTDFKVADCLIVGCLGATEVMLVERRKIPIILLAWQADERRLSDPPHVRFTGKTIEELRSLVVQVTQESWRNRPRIPIVVPLPEINERYAG